MKATNNNPEGNILGPGIEIEAIKEAIERSGYPLQTVVGNTLRNDFAVMDEWSFLDRDTNELRAIDLRAHKDLTRIYLGLRKPKRQILGLELAGDIEAVGKDVNQETGSTSWRSKYSRPNIDSTEG